MCATALFLCVVLMVISKITASEVSFCPPGEEFQAYNLTSQKIYFNNAMWLHNGDIIVVCPDFNTCAANSEKYVGIYSANNINYTSVLTIKNVTRERIGNYTYETNGESSQLPLCEFQVYARPTEMNCEAKNDLLNVTFSCKVDKTYPSPICQISYNHNENHENITEKISYQVKNITEGNYTYYSSNCSVSLSAKDLNLGSYTFLANGYPNVTGTNADIDFGKNSSLQFLIHSPQVTVEDCLNKTYQEYTNVTCTCKETANIFLNATVKLYNGTSLLNEGSRESVYSFTAYRYMNALSCDAQLLNFKSNLVNFTFDIAYGPDEVILKVTQNETEINTTIDLCDITNPVAVVISCEIPKGSVSPSATIQMFINGTKTSNNFTYIARAGGPLNLSCLGSNDKFSQINTNTPKLVNITEPPMEPKIYIDQRSSTQQLSSKKITTPEGFITIGCRAENGYPLATGITINCGSDSVNSSVSNEAFISFNISKQMDMGNCSCSASHPSSCYRNNTTMVVLNVTFPSKVSLMKINNKEENITVERNSSVQFFCVGEGNPSPIMLLTKNNSQLDNSSDPDEKFNLTLTFTKDLTDCRDTGVFVCQAGNSSKSFTVFVNCAQELSDPTINDTVYSASIDKSFDINISILGYPEPTIFNVTSDEPLNFSNYNLSYIHLEPPYGYLSFKILTVRKEVFQNYTLNITNKLGSLIYRFQISDVPLVKKVPDPGGYDIAAIVGGVVAGVVVVVAIILIIILLRRKGILGKEKKSGSTEMLATDKDVDNSKIYEMNKVDVDNSDIYNLNSDSQQTDVDNADIYNMQSQLPVEVDNASIYNMKKTDSEKPRKNSEYKKYTDVTTTVTTASAAPKNMKTTVIPETTYEDVHGATKLEPKANPKPPKPVPKPKPGQQLAKSDKTKAGNSVGTNQTYSTVVIEKKSAKPVSVNDKKEKELDFNTTEPEIPERNYEKKENNMNAKEQKAPLNPTPDYHNVIKTTNDNPESTTIINSELSNRQNETDLYANETASFNPTPDYHNVIESTNENPESTIVTNSGLSHAQNDTDVYANMTE